MSGSTCGAGTQKPRRLAREIRNRGLWYALCMAVVASASLEVS